MKKKKNVISKVTGRKRERKGKTRRFFPIHCLGPLTGTVKITVIEMMDFIVENSENELFLKIGKVHS